jgi:hypothetical protein
LTISQAETSIIRVGYHNALACLAALTAAAIFTLLGWAQHSPFEAPLLLRGTDDMVRMVDVRDFLNGQSWFDQMQYRLGVEPGTLMHWSRLVDAPIAGLVMIGKALNFGNGERFASIAWPFLTFSAAFAGLFACVRRGAGSANLLPALVIGGFALTGSGVFDSGVIDHHNAQLALTIWLIASLIPSQRPNTDFAAAGIITSVMLAIGMESLPTVIAGACAVALRLAMEGGALAGPVRRFGLALSVSTAALFLCLTAPQNYGAKFCDSLSLFQLVCAGSGGLLLYLGLHPAVQKRLPSPLVSAPLIAGFGAAALAFLFFPDCLRAPGAELGPTLRHFWFDKVIETQSVFQIARLDPWLLPYMHVLPLIACGALIWLVAKGRSRPVYAPLLLFVIVTSAVTLFQMRGTQYALPVAALALSIIVTRFAEGQGKEKPGLLLGAMTFSCILVWKIISRGAIAVFSDGKTGPLIASGTDTPPQQCESAGSIDSLGALPAGLVAGSNNLGPVYLLKTRHRVLSGPYHRNIEGNLAWINAMTGTPDEARAILEKAKVTILAICPTEADESSLTAEAPDGFLAQLISGKSFDWLRPVQDTMDKPLKLWRVAS